MSKIIKIARWMLALTAVATANPALSFANGYINCNSVGPWDSLGNGNPVSVTDTLENIAHLSETDVCKIPKMTTMRVACHGRYAIYIRNLENKDTAYKCVNYVWSADGVVKECQKGGSFGPAFSKGAKWATILVGDDC